jgi:hypothetical protein
MYRLRSDLKNPYQAEIGLQQVTNATQNGCNWPMISIY